MLHKALFFQSGGEMLVVWLRVEPMLAGLRQSWKDSTMLSNFETVAVGNEEWWSKSSPGEYEAMEDFVSG